MSESIKNLQATTLRMAGNIAAGLVNNPEFRNLDSHCLEGIANVSVDLAQRIVQKLTAPVNSDPRCPKCGFTMVQGFTEVHVSSTRSVAHPNGEYRCFHCTTKAEATK
ncbi:MAG TPA: hypothetical protein VN513_01755 [Gemmatimonadales bacterium]|nr:hypothetical protein [Gemmatimonadales bacterium]